jgi:hypothetical protein
MAVERVPYQVVLRAVGAYLDEHGASQSNVIELEDGFAVRYQRKTNPPVYGFGRFTYDDLAALTSHLEWHRSPRGGKGLAGGYQDLFRALGYELDEVQAYAVLLDEVEDQLLVTYLELDPAHTIAALKRLIVVGQDEQREVLESAQRRRGEGQRGVLEGLAQNIGPRGSGEAAFPRQQRAPDDAPWEIGERELYSTHLRNVWIQSKDSFGPAEMVLTNRRIILRFGNGDVLRVRLDDFSAISRDAGRDLLARRYRMELRGPGSERLGLDCRDEEHLDEVAAQIERARSSLEL